MKPVLAQWTLVEDEMLIDVRRTCLVIVFSCWCRVPHMCFSCATLVPLLCLAYDTRCTVPRLPLVAPLSSALPLLFPSSLVFLFVLSFFVSLVYPLSLFSFFANLKKHVHLFAFHVRVWISVSPRAWRVFILMAHLLPGRNEANEHATVPGLSCFV